MKVPKTIKLFIQGSFPRSESGRSFPVKDLTSGEIFAQIPLASRKDLRAAVEAAKNVQPSWQKKTAFNRSQILYRIAEMMEGKREEFVEALEKTCGLSRDEASGEVTRGIDAWVYYAGFCDKFQQVMGAVNPVSGPHHCFTSSEPLGVVALIQDQNFSLVALCSEIAATIGGGNTAVALLDEGCPAILSPLSETLATSDLPGGVVNLLTGNLKELGEPIARHLEIDGLCYLGHDAAVLEAFQRDGVENLKRVRHVNKPPLGLEPILAFQEMKTVWHPVGV